MVISNMCISYRIRGYFNMRIVTHVSHYSMSLFYSWLYAPKTMCHDASFVVGITSLIITMVAYLNSYIIRIRPVFFQLSPWYYTTLPVALTMIRIERFSPICRLYVFHVRLTTSPPKHACMLILRIRFDLHLNTYHWCIRASG